jgi:hypothetical protein
MPKDGMQGVAAGVQPPAVQSGLSVVASALCCTSICKYLHFFYRIWFLVVRQWSSSRDAALPFTCLLMAHALRCCQ